MRRSIVVIIMAVVIQLPSSVVYGEFYYSSGNQIPLMVDTLRIVLKLDEGPCPSGVDQLMETFPRIAGAIGR